LDKRDKLKLSESDICDLFISPALKEAKWNPLTQIRREVTLTPGPVVVRGNLSSRNRKKKKFADYVLSWRPSLPIAVVEAKDNTIEDSPRSTLKVISHQSLSLACRLPPRAATTTPCGLSESATAKGSGLLTRACG
jgi:type I site-specific restriction endonuclease